MHTYGLLLSYRCCWTEKVAPLRIAPTKFNTSVARVETKIATRGKSCGYELGQQQLTLAGGAAGDAMDPKYAPHCVGGSGAAAVSQQGLELSTLLVLKVAVCLSVAYHWTEM